MNNNKSRQSNKLGMSPKKSLSFLTVTDLFGDSISHSPDGDIVHGKYSFHSLKVNTIRLNYVGRHRHAQFPVV